MTGQELRLKRTQAAIPGTLLCARAGGFDRARLSAIERGYLKPRDPEMNRLIAALDELVHARKRVSEVAAEVGWPMG